MKLENQVLLAINDSIIALDIEDVLHSKFNASIVNFNTAEAIDTLSLFNPKLAIVDYDANDRNVLKLVDQLEKKTTNIVCLCTSNDQEKKLERRKVHTLFKPLDFDALENIISNMNTLQSNVEAEEIASGP